MGEEGPSHTTLWRMATGKVKQPQPLVERYVSQGIERINRNQDGPEEYNPMLGS